MYQVLELDSVQLVEACAELATLVRNDDYRPSLVIGIRRAGVVVGELIAQELDVHLPLAQVGASRPSTSAKDRPAGRKLLSALPASISTALRKAEHFVLTRRGLGERKVDAEAISTIAATVPAAGCVLVVDDAADTGSSLVAVVEALQGPRPDVRIRTAVLAKDSQVPDGLVNYSWRTNVLLRGPWSFDV